MQSSPERCSCRCHGDEPPLATDPIAVVFACTLCQGAHVDAFSGRLPLYPRPPKEPSDQADGSSGNPFSGETVG